MQPTTNTPFERFAFVAVILMSVFFLLMPFILMPVAHIGGAFTIFCLLLFASLGFPIFCVVCAIKIEDDHLNALAKAEAELSDIVVSDMKTLPSNWKPVKTVFILDNVVIANDYIKTFFWSFRKLFGGESKSFSKMTSRARREATVRVLRKAKEYGANVVWNIRYETSTIQSNYAKDGSKTIAGVEVLAYATAFTVAAE